MLTIEVGVASLPAAAAHVIINMADDEPLDMRHWIFAPDLVDRSLEPPVEYPLVAAARGAVRLKQLRRAVVDASTAAELALTHLLDANYAGLTAGVQGRLRSNDATLGWLVDTVTNGRRLPALVLAVRSNLAATLATDLVDLRNEVIHMNKQPTLAEAAEAARLARETVMPKQVTL